MNKKGALPVWLTAVIAAAVIVAIVVIATLATQGNGNNGNGGQTPTVLNCSELNFNAKPIDMGTELTLDGSNISDKLAEDLTLFFKCYNDSYETSSAKVDASASGARDEEGNFVQLFTIPVDGQFTCQLTAQKGDKTCTRTATVNVTGNVAVCGNGKCEAGESSYQCADDCFCGNGSCDPGENKENCSQDCVFVCGNGKCDSGEHFGNCPEDCEGTEVNGFKVTVKPKEKTIHLQENVLVPETQHSMASFRVYFTNATGKTQYIHNDYIGFDNICSQGNLGQCVKVILEPKTPFICKYYKVENGESLVMDLLMTHIGKHDTSRDYRFRAWVKYSQRSNCTAHNPCKWTEVKSPQMLLSVKVFSQTDEEVYYPEVYRNKQECKVGSLTGYTGPGAVPRMLFTWNWDDIHKFDCDQRGCHSGTSKEEEYGGEYFCDETQFAITLFKKLQEINNYYEEGRSSMVPDHMMYFKSFLKGTNFSDDFKEDFVNYYVNEFFGSTPAWFYETGNWNRYFVDKDGKANDLINFKFENNYREPGMYTVAILTESLDGEPVTNGFFNGTEPRVKITVSFSKALSDFPDSPLLKMNFNGKIGTTGNNVNREGYGFVSKPGSDPIIIAKKGNDFIETPLISGDHQFQTVKSNTFQALNWSKRGVVLRLGSDNLIFSESMPVNVIFGVENYGQDIGGFYRILDSQKTPVRNERIPQFMQWRIIRTTPNLACSGFSQEEIDYDNEASSYVVDTCVLEGKTNAYGFWWDKPVKKTGKMLLSGFVYVPNSKFVFERVCGPGSFFAIDGETFNTKTLQNLSYKLESIEGVVDQAINGNICVTEDGSTFFWNEPKLFSESNARKATDAEWGKGTFDSMEEC